MFDELEKYKSWGHFFFNPDDDLKKVCDAPKNGIGVYYILEMSNDEIQIVFIDSEGKVDNNGEIRSYGLYHNIVNGNQFGFPRNKSWNQKLKKEGIDALDIYWFETFDEENQDSPTYVKALIMQSFISLHGRLPKWNTEF